MAGQAATVFSRALEKETDYSPRNELAQGLVAVAGRMEPAEAARVLTGALEKETNRWVRNELAQGIRIVVGRLSTEEAATVMRPALQTMLQAADTQTDEMERFELAKVVASLLSASDERDASQVAAKLAFAVCSGQEVSHTGRGATYYPVGIDSLDALLASNSRSEVSRRSMEVASFVGLVNVTPFAALPVLPTASEPLPCRLSTQDLVELLKMPTCFGEARKVVLKHLGNRYGRVFANHWEFVRFAQEQRLDLDLTSPPKRWLAHQPGMRRTIDDMNGTEGWRAAGLLR